MAIFLLQGHVMLWSDLLGALSFQVPSFSFADFKKLVGSESPQIVEDYFNLKSDWIFRSENTLKELKAKNIQWLSPESHLYPKRFKWMKEPPVFLTYIGDMSCFDRGILSVVGSREPSQAGREFLSQELGIVLQKLPMTIVSGAARGIDQAAHSCALRNKCSTVAILPSGIHAPYPREFKSWVRPILDLGGCILSEYFPGKIMHRHHFYRRNQIIVGSTKSLLVVEARRKSGSMMTARHALENHCDVGVVPGFPLNPQYGGSLDLLIGTNAVIIRDHLDLLNLMANAEPR
ncbi:MAG: hypothetical protein A4S09_06155 [Proteobacteria bacterium SG_bin7]|nr:MAG: hypothetical protein A4S09_06155 [Proteobacteria bacterium SG_bin7]